MNVFLGWIGGFLMGVGIMLSVYTTTHSDTGAECLERYNAVDEIAACVDILNGG